MSDIPEPSEDDGAIDLAARYQQCEKWRDRAEQQVIRLLAAERRRADSARSQALEEAAKVVDEFFKGSLLALMEGSDIEELVDSIRALKGAKP